MNWSPLSESDLWDLINNSWDRMSLEQRKYWEILKVNPEKWIEPQYGTVGGGFWVVAVFGNLVLWYNDIEDGFNLSQYKCYGKINEYWCNQDELEVVIQNVINLFKDGYDASGKSSPPNPIV